MTICVVIGLPAPLLPIHLLWINLVTDGLPALCLATDPIDPDVMKRRPRRRDERITEGGFLPKMFLTGILTAGVSFAVYLYGLKFETLELARTHAFAALVFAELLRSFGARSETRPIWRMNFLSNFNLLAVVALSLALQIWSHHNLWLAGFLKTSLVPVRDCLILLALSSVPLLVLEMRKVIFAKQRTRSKIMASARRPRRPWRKAAILVFGGLTVAMGIAMIILPGPAFIFIPLGLAILATEFRWAKRWLAATRQWIRHRIAKRKQAR